jgi:phage baseplate assembly protein W
MNLEFYTLPLAVDKLMKQQGHPKCTLQQSVMQHLHLLMTTASGEFRADEQFGCGIWDYDFDNVTNGNRIKEIIRQSLLQTIQLKERRLGNVRVEILLRQEESPITGGKSIRKKIDVTITGLLQLTNEKISFKDSFFVGPLSY